MAEESYLHMDQVHPGHGLFSKWCDECLATRPDNTSLMMHKLTHLETNSTGPKIKIITNNGGTPVQKEFKVYKDLICGLCSGKFPVTFGSLSDHFKHAEDCLVTRAHGLSCLFCPTINFLNSISVVNHWNKLHSFISQEISCIWCGQIFKTVDFNGKHLLECKQRSKYLKLYQDQWTLCPYCPTLFFFANLDQTPFFIAHMNTFHQQKIESKWSQKCLRCTSFLPNIEAARIHQEVCYKSATSIRLHTRDVIHYLKGKRISTNWASGPNDGLIPQTEAVTFQNCGLCCKRVSGELLLSRMSIERTRTLMIG